MNHKPDVRQRKSQSHPRGHLEHRYEHRRLDCGIELAMLPIRGRGIAALEVRMLAGFAFEPPELLGVSNVLEDVITKGTVKRDGRALNDAFDVIGAAHGSAAGRETIAFSCICLPEFLEEAIRLHAEVIRTPTLPEDACRVAVELAQQSLGAMDDDPQELARKLLHRQGYGEPLGRHVLGEAETLERIDRQQVLEHWQRYFAAPRMLVAVAGGVDPDRIADLLEREFDGFGEPTTQTDQKVFPIHFEARRTHKDKEVEQEQIAICFPGAAATDLDFPVEQVTVAILAGGMSGRLFTEVREKQGLVYWVGAWSDQPRRGGMVHLGASTTPQKLDKTYATLLRELDRLGQDVTQQEVERAVTGIVTRTRTRGDVTRARAGELIDDLFYYGRPIPTEEKLARVSRVTVDDVRSYLESHPRDRLCVVTLGPKPLS